MSRRALVLVLALLQTLTVAAGARAAVALRAPATTVAIAPIGRTPAEPVLRARPVTAHVVRPAPVRRHTRPKVAPRPRPRPRPVHHAAAPRRTRVVVASPPRRRTTPHQRMMAAVDRLPGYRTGDATWYITSAYGHWGMADMGRGIIYISPDVPADRMYDVVAHEWSHVLSVKPYDAAMEAVVAMNTYFGGSGMTGAERGADCMARILGATWTHYTSCGDARWRDGARRLLARQRL
ncbi:MAG TPA: hypothetical protein VM097_09520 [Mycobacteriales bacterium]|nr:hypothetical protein [Mycobacteriales bacterium]